MDFEAGEFFYADTARLIGYITDFNPLTKEKTGLIYVDFVISGENYPVVIQIREDGRFEADIPIRYPQCLSITRNVSFYIQPGQTLAMVMTMKNFQKGITTRDTSHILYFGPTAKITEEINYAHHKLSQSSTSSIRRVYNGIENKNPDEFKTFFDERVKTYTQTFNNLLDTGNFSEPAKKILQNDLLITNASIWLDYARGYERANPEDSLNAPKLPVEFYNFLQDIPMNNKELLSTQNFSSFLGVFASCDLFIPGDGIYTYSSTQGLIKKDYVQYLFDELGFPKTPEDELLLRRRDSVWNAYSQSVTQADKEKLLNDYETMYNKFIKKYGREIYENYKKKYVEIIRLITPKEVELERWRFKDSVYTNVLKLQPGIVYDITKIWGLNYDFERMLESGKEDALDYWTTLSSNISEPFLKEEGERLFAKIFLEDTVEKTYELPNTPAANIFKELITPHNGKYLLVDFWATSCGPCLGNIKRQKKLREKYKDNPDVDFVFITSEYESPLNAYEKFVNEQELTHTYRIPTDDYRYLRQLFRFNGIPRYILVDKEGKIIDDDFSYSHFSEWLREMSLD